MLLHALLVPLALAPLQDPASGEAPAAARAVALDAYGDPLPEGAVARLGTQRLLHPYAVSAVCLGPDGTWFATGCEDGIVRVFDAADGALRRELDATGHGAVLTIDVTDDGRRLLAATRFQALNAFDLESGERLFQRPLTAYVAVWQADGARYAASTEDSVVRIVDTASGEEHATLDIAPFSVDSLERSPDGRWLAARSRNRLKLLGRGAPDDDLSAVHVWDAATLELVATIPFQDASVTDIAFTPDGDTVYVSDDLGRVDTYSLAEREPLDVVAGDGQPIVALACSPDGTRLYATRMEGGVERIAPATGERARVFDTGIAPYTDLRVRPSDGALLGILGMLVELRTPDGAPLLAPQRHTSVVTALRYAPDGRRIASVSHDGSLCIWDAASGRPVGRELRAAGWLFDAAWWPDASRIAAACRDGSVYVWRTGGDSEGWRIPLGDVGVTSVDVAPDGAHLLAATGDGHVHLLRVTDDADAPFESLGRIDGVASVAPIARFAGGGDQALIAGSGLTLHSLPKFEELRSLGQFHSPVHALALGNDGRVAAIGLADGAVRTIQIADGKRFPPLVAHTTRVHGVALSPDGLRAAAVSEHDDLVVVWRISDGQEVARWRGQRTPLTSIAFSPDGSRVATGGFDGTVLIWER